jgi:hypothetical protein
VAEGPAISRVRVVGRGFGATVKAMVRGPIPEEMESIMSPGSEAERDQGQDSPVVSPKVAEKPAAGALRAGGVNVMRH